MAVFSIVPSPYQRDLFQSLSTHVDLSVFYLEPSSPDSPWPEKPLTKFESVLPGIFISIRGMRFHFNWKMPSMKDTDVVIVNGYMGILFQWLLRFRYRRHNLIFWGERMTGQPEGIKGNLQRWMSGVLGNCKVIVAIGTRAQQEYEKRFPSMPVYNIPYHCSLQVFQQLPLRKAKAPVQFLFCGQMIYRKGLDILLKAFEKLAQHGAQLHLVGREAELVEMLSHVSPRSKEKIIYHGFQAPEKLPDFFAMADVFVLPSRYDGWGVVVNQALGAGLPVICSDQVGAGLDLIEEGNNGFRFVSGDADDLCSKMKCFVDHPELIESQSTSSRHKSLSMSPEHGALRWVEVIKRVKQG